jgi:transcription termination factor Rho
MTEPNLSPVSEPSALLPGKRPRKRGTTTGTTTGTTDPVDASETQSHAAEPGPSGSHSLPTAKKRGRPATKTQTNSSPETDADEATPRKRAPRGKSPAATVPNDTTASSPAGDTIRERKPDLPAATHSAEPTRPKARRRREIAEDSQPERSGPSDHVHSVKEQATETDPPVGETPPKARRGRPPRPSAVANPPPPAPPAGARGEDVPASATAADSVDQAERARKPYPVYVPLHIAKQMEQEGRPAPLALDPDAHQAEAVRAAALENRHGTSHGHAEASIGNEEVARESLDRREGHRQDNAPQQPQNQHQRHERGQQQHPNQRQDRNQRPPQRGPGQERQREGRHNDRDRHRNREDHRRGQAPGGGGHQDSHREQHQELPPPTPEELFTGGGVIEISGKGFGFLRDPLRNFAQHPADIFVSPEMVRRFNLRDGQMIRGSVRKSGRGQQMHEITSVNDDPPEDSKHQPSFDELTVINPCEPLQMATVPERYTTRIIDMLTPIGKGQRGLIVAQPRTGKTTFLQHIADAMVKNHPDVTLIILLVDERPEEVTEIRHTVPSAEIMASSNDMDVRSHTRIAELAIERAKRLVEAGKDVFILLDSITRLGRAFNNALSNGGRTMSGGLDARALETPRKLFAAARNTEEAGSLTIIATALIDTGSRMDEIIFQEFKGTGNMELVLDRKIAESRIYPAVDIFQSGTRREELLVPADLLQKIHFLRRGLSGARPMDAIDRLLSYLRKFQTNEQMLREIRG